MYFRLLQFVQRADAIGWPRAGESPRRWQQRAGIGNDGSKSVILTGILSGFTSFYIPWCPAWPCLAYLVMLLCAGFASRESWSWGCQGPGTPIRSWTSCRVVLGWDVNYLQLSSNTIINYNSVQVSSTILSIFDKTCRFPLMFSWICWLQQSLGGYQGCSR